MQHSLYRKYFITDAIGMIVEVRYFGIAFPSFSVLAYNVITKASFLVKPRKKFTFIKLNLDDRTWA